MALLCGRCIICAHEFYGDATPDVGVRWSCASGRDACVGRPPHDHAICNDCVGGLLDGTLESAVKDLVALIARRRDIYGD